MTRVLLRAALGASFVFAAAGVFAQGTTPPRPEMIADITVPSGLSLGGVTFGGISDLTWDATTGLFRAISDDRIEHGPARYYDLWLTPDGGVLALDIVAMHELTDAGGAAFGPKGADPEGIAYDAGSGRLFWSSERDGEGVPAIYVVAADGSTTSIALPEAYLPKGDTSGVYGNQGFEGLDLSADGTTLYAATESGLMQDGPKATLEVGSPSRIMRIDTATLRTTGEYLYVTEPIYTAATEDPFWNDNGISAIATLDDGRLVVVERSFALGVGNMIRFIIADLSGATDISAAGVEGAVLVEKSLWFEINEGDYGLDIDNIESFVFGPEIDGARSFVIASDDNFNPSGQFTQFVMFTIPTE